MLGKGERKDIRMMKDSPAFNHDEIIGARFPHLPKQLESQRAVLDSASWEKENKWSECPPNTQAYCLEISGLSTSRGKWKSGDFTNTKRQISEFGEAKAMKIHGTKYKKIGSYTERALEIYRGVSLSLWLNIDLDKCVRKLWETGERIIKQEYTAITRAHTKRD